MNQKLDNSGPWALFTLFLLLAVSTFGYTPVCTPAYDPPVHIRSDGVVIVDSNACEPTAININNRIVHIVRILAVVFSLCAIATLVWILRRNRLHKLNPQNLLLPLE